MQSTPDFREARARAFRIASSAFWLVLALGLARGARADDALAAIAERVARGEVAGALELVSALPSQRQARADLRYLRARLHEQEGKHAAALASLPEDDAELPGSVARDVRSRRAFLLVRLGKCRQARPLLEALAKEDAAGELTLRAAECALAGGDPKAALALLRGLRGGAQKRVDVRRMLARALAKTGELKAARSELRQLYLSRPAHAQAAAIERQLRALGDRRPLRAEERVQRARALLEARRPEAALAELERLRGEDEKRVQASLLHLRGMALFSMRTRYPEAARVLARAAAISSETQAQDAYHAARALARADQDARAVAAYRAFAKRFPKSSLAHDALYQAAWLELRHGLPGGEARMRELLDGAQKRKDHEKLAAALWDLAFHALVHGKPERAEPLFVRYAQTQTTPMVRARGLYWAGRSQTLAGEPRAALAHYRAAREVEPLHYYALLAEARLRELGEDPGDPFGEDASLLAGPLLAAASHHAAAEPEGEKRAHDGKKTSVPASPAPHASPLGVSAPALPDDVIFYARLGLRADALRALREHEARLRDPENPDGALLPVVQAYFALDEHARPYRLVEREYTGVLRKRPEPSTRWLWETLFPRPYAGEVEEAARKERLEHELIYSIMRKESAFDPRVVSVADAIGLMQLLERTAKLTARSAGMAELARVQLYDPAVNVRLGTHYLARLVRRYGGQYVPAIAAYNAGEHRVDAWLARARARDEPIELDLFVEEIPIEQTRNYVRRVLANWARYRYLAEPGRSPLLELPVHLRH